MAQEYILIKEKSDDCGMIALSKGVFETITQISVDEIDGVSLMESSPIKKAHTCKITNNKLNVLVDVRVKYGLNVNQNCEKIQNRIHQNILLMTNLSCENIDVKVSGFAF